MYRSKQDWVMDLMAAGWTGLTILLTFTAHVVILVGVFAVLEARPWQLAAAMCVSIAYLLYQVRRY